MQRAQCISSMFESTTILALFGFPVMRRLWAQSPAHLLRPQSRPQSLRECFFCSCCPPEAAAALGPDARGAAAAAKAVAAAVKALSADLSLLCLVHRLLGRRQCEADAAGEADGSVPQA